MSSLNHVYKESVQHSPQSQTSTSQGRSPVAGPWLDQTWQSERGASNVLPAACVADKINWRSITWGER